jgi:phosphonate transport system permease protein
MNTALDNTPPDQTTVADILSAERRGWARAGFQGGLIVLVILGCAVQTGLADWQRLSEGVPAMMTLFGDMIPPDFSSAEKWIVPILDTLAMSIAGTALAVGLSLPLGFLAARNTAPNPTVYWIAKGTLNFLRAVPELIMGIVFVAAVSFAPCRAYSHSGFTRLA